MGDYAVYDFGRRTLRQCEHVHQTRPAAAITTTFTVRVKDIPRILGGDGARVKHISKQSRTSIAISVDMRALLMHTAYIEITGLQAQVSKAIELIITAIKEVYDISRPRLAMAFDFLQDEDIPLPMYKGLHVLKHINLLNIEDQTSTWIEVNATRPQRAGAHTELSLHITGQRRGINAAKSLIISCANKAKKPAGPVVKVGRALRTGGKASGRVVCVGLKYLLKRLKKKKQLDAGVFESLLS